MTVKMYTATSKVQADGVQTIEMEESGFVNQVSVGGDATSGTLAFEYKAAGKWFNLLASDGSTQLSVDMASNTKAFIVQGCLDAVRVTPTSISGGSYTVQVISEVLT